MRAILTPASIALLLGAQAGCYVAHERSVDAGSDARIRPDTRPPPRPDAYHDWPDAYVVRSDAHVVRTDAWAPRDAWARDANRMDTGPRVDAPAPACGETVACGGDVPVPMLHYRFDGDLVSTGGVTAAAMMPAGNAPAFVDGPVGLALRLRPGQSVRAPQTSALLANASELTFSVWVHTDFSAPERPATAGRTYLGCRSFDRGFETYGYPTRLYTCAGDGYGPPRAWGGCGNVGGCVRDGWAQFVLRWRDGNAPEIAVFGDGFTTLHAGRTTPSEELGYLAGLDLFDGATDLEMGVGAGDGYGRNDGTILVDDLRVYDRFLDDDVVWTVTRCPTP